MRKLTYLGLTLLLATGISLAAPKEQTFVGNISDDMCGLKHMMPGQSDKDCTLECVKGGSKFVLADRAKQKVYKLSDQDRPKAFAGQQVKVTGTLQGDTIQVSSIAAAE